MLFSANDGTRTIWLPLFRRRFWTTRRTSHAENPVRRVAPDTEPIVIIIRRSFRTCARSFSTFFVPMHAPTKQAFILSVPFLMRTAYTPLMLARTAPPTNELQAMARAAVCRFTSTLPGHCPNNTHPTDSSHTLDGNGGASVSPVTYLSA